MFTITLTEIIKYKKNEKEIFTLRRNGKQLWFSGAGGCSRIKSGVRVSSGPKTLSSL